MSSEVDTQRVDSLPLKPPIKSPPKRTTVKRKKKNVENLSRTQTIINFFKFKWVLTFLSYILQTFENFFSKLNERRKEKVVVVQEKVHFSLTIVTNIFRIIGYYLVVLILLGLIICIISTTIFFASTVTYGFLYNTYVPRVFTLQQPVYFEMEPIFNSENNGKPTATFPIPHLLQDGGSYSISLHLLLPTSYTNQNLGNFMCRGVLKTRYGKEISRSSRPAILPYKSPVTRFLQNIFYSIPLILGFMEETELVEVTLYPLFTENSEIGLTREIELILSSPEIEIQSATLYITTELVGLHYFLYYYFTIATSMAISFIFFFYWISFIFLTISIFILWRYYDLPIPIKLSPSLYDNVNNVDIVNNLNQNNVDKNNIEIVRIDEAKKEETVPKMKEKIILSPKDFQKSKDIQSVIDRIEQDLPQSSIDQIQINDEGHVESVVTSHKGGKDKDEEEFIELTKPYEPHPPAPLT